MRRPAVVGSLALATALALPTAPASASTAEVGAEQVIFQTTDEDNVPHMGFTVCAKPHGPDHYQVDLYLLTPDHQPSTGDNCGTIRVTDLPGVQEMLDSVELDPDGTARAGDDYDSHEVRNVCNVYQFFPGTNILSGNVLNDAVDAPIDVIVQVITLLTADTIDAKPTLAGSCL
jgi:hypothetical protein